MRKRTIKARANGATYAYIRVSTPRQKNKGVSMDQQRHAVTHYCTGLGETNLRVIEDGGITSKKPLARRPGGSQLVADAAAGKVKRIVLYKLNRAFRNMQEALNTILSWDSAGIEVVVLDLAGMQIDFSTPMGRMMLAVVAGFDEITRANIAEVTSDNLQYLKGDMQPYTRDVYGYENVSGERDEDGNRLTAGQLVEVPEEQAVLERMKDMRGRGRSYHQIAATLNEQSIPTKRGGDWHASTVRSILTNELHAAAVIVES